MVYSVNVKSDIDNGGVKTSTVIKALLEKYNTLHTDKELNNTSLLDLYTIDNDNKYNVYNGYSSELKKDLYKIEVFA